MAGRDRRFCDSAAVRESGHNNRHARPACGCVATPMSVQRRGWGQTNPTHQRMSPERHGVQGRADDAPITPVERCLFVKISSGVRVI